MRATLLIIAVATLGCDVEVAPPPRISAVVPSEGANDVDVVVEISGENFEPRIHTDFSAPEQSGWNRSFSAALVPVDKNLPELALADVRLERPGVLVGTVKSAAARGFYGLRVIDSFGREGFVPEVYRVVASATQVTGFRVDPIGPQRPGVPFTLQLAAVDAAGSVVDGFAVGVDVSISSGLVTPARIEAFALGRARVQLTVDALGPAQILRVADGVGRVGSSNPFAVRPGLVVELVFLSPAQMLASGECSKAVELEARDTFGFSAKLEAALDAELLSAGPASTRFFADAACTEEIGALRVPAGDSRASFYFRGGGPGNLLLRVVPSELPSVSQAQMVTP